MLNKVIMMTLCLLMGYQAKSFVCLPASLERLPASDLIASSGDRQTQSLKQMQNICMIHAGDIGKLKFKGKTYEQAFSRVTDECFQKRTQLYVESRKAHPDQDRQIQFAESCVNAVKCI